MKPTPWTRLGAPARSVVIEHLRAEASDLYAHADIPKAHAFTSAANVLADVIELPELVEEETCGTS